MCSIDLLDAIISVDYRINSKQATHFSIWTTDVLREHIVKGFTRDAELLKKGSRFGKITFTICFQESVKYMHPREDSIKKSLIYMQQLQTTVLMRMKQKISLTQCRICYFLP